MAINLRSGKTLDEAMEIVRLGKAKTGKKMKFQYWKIGDYFSRMEEAFGIAGFGVRYSLKDPYTFPNGQVMITCECTIDIYGENNEVVHSVMGCGAWELVRTSDGKGYVDFKNDAYNAQTSAFKSACKMLNIFCTLDNEKEEGGNNYSNSSNNSNNWSNNSGYSNSNTSTPANSGGNQQSVEESISFYVMEAIKEVRRDNNTGKMVYELTAYKMVGDAQYDDKTSYKIVFYPNKYKDCEDAFNKLRQRQRPYKQTFKVKMGSQGGYIFCGFGG